MLLVTFPPPSGESFRVLTMSGPVRETRGMVSISAVVLLSRVGTKTDLEYHDSFTSNEMCLISNIHSDIIAQMSRALNFRSNVAQICPIPKVET